MSAPSGSRWVPEVEDGRRTTSEGMEGREVMGEAKEGVEVERVRAVERETGSVRTMVNSRVEVHTTGRREEGPGSRQDCRCFLR